MGIANLNSAKMKRASALPDGYSALSAAKLTKVYADGTRALSEVDLEIPRGSIFCLLGRNGAGKTTFVRIASTQLLPTSGSVTVLGFDAVREPERIRPLIALVPQEGRPGSMMTPREHIIHYLVARGFGWSEAASRAREILEQLELTGYADSIASNLSGGLRQRTLVAMALAADAELYFLDEPTLGLDAVTRLRIWGAIRRKVSEDGCTVLLTTHYMDEAEALSDYVAIVHRGRVLLQGRPAELLKPYRAYVRLELPATLLEALQLDPLPHITRLGDTVRVLVPKEMAQEVAQRALSAGVDLQVKAVGLEDLFVSLVGEGLAG